MPTVIFFLISFNHSKKTILLIIVQLNLLISKWTYSIVYPSFKTQWLFENLNSCIFIIKKSFQIILLQWNRETKSKRKNTGFNFFFCLLFGENTEIFSKQQILFLNVVPRINIDLKVTFNRRERLFLGKKLFLESLNKHLFSTFFFLSLPLFLSQQHQNVYVKIACLIRLNSSYKFLNISF